MKLVSRIAFVSMEVHRREPVLARLAAGLLMVLSAWLALSRPNDLQHARMPDAWAYAFAAENFAAGRWIVTDDELAAGQMQARLAGGHLVQYVPLGPDRWGLEKAPGFPLLAVPFQWLGFPGLTNSVLAAAAAAALYALVARWRSEPLACMAVMLFLLAPMTLAAQRDVWMDTFAGGTLALTGGVLYALYLLRGASDRAGLALLFGAGLALGGSALVRLTNAPLIGLFALHLLIAGWRAKRIPPGTRRRSGQPDGRAQVSAAVSFGLGAALALSVLVLYNQAVFGRPFDTGYAYSPFRISSALGPAIGKPGAPASTLGPGPAVQLVGRNLWHLLPPWLIGFPLLLLAVPGWFASRSPAAPPGAILPRWLSTVWILVIMLPYLSFTWLDQLLSRGGTGLAGFAEVDRYFFPWIFPLTALALAFLDRLPRPAAWGLAALYGIGSLWLYGQVLW
jgi:hypothetical protein